MPTPMMTLKELNAERTKQAEHFFHPQVLKHWREAAKVDAAKDVYLPIKTEFMDALVEHVYTIAWSRERDRIGREERDAAEAKAASSPNGGSHG